MLHKFQEKTWNSSYTRRRLGVRIVDQAKTRRILYENLAKREVPGRLAAGTVYSKKRRFVSYSSGWKSLSQRLVYQLEVKRPGPRIDYYIDLQWTNGSHKPDTWPVSPVPWEVAYLGATYRRGLKLIKNYSFIFNVNLPLRNFCSSCFRKSFRIPFIFITMLYLYVFLWFSNVFLQNKSTCYIFSISRLLFSFFSFVLLFSA